MVRGRRPRTVAYPRTDDCSSPNPKKRIELTIDTAILKPAKTNTITDFFQGVDVYQVKNAFDITKTEKTENEDLLITLMAKNEVDDVPKTPRSDKMTELPPTPHRIELNEEKPKEKKKKLANHKVTDYFPVRRSVRKTKTTVLEEKQRSLEQLLRKNVEEGLEVKIFSDKGRGVVTSKFFTKGDFVVEYSGDLIDLTEAKRREQKYAQDLTTGCYMYYFKHNNQQYCVDATAETGRLGRLVNHSRNGNLVTKTVSVDNRPRLVLIAKNDIAIGEEITYDYGDRSKESLKYHPWLAY